AVSTELHAIAQSLRLPIQPTTRAIPVGPATLAASTGELAWSGIQPSSPSTATPARSREAGDTETPPSLRRTREAERRQVTVLVCACDLFESETYLGLESEDQAQVFGA